MNYSFTIQPNSTFNYDMLTWFALSRDMSCKINSDNTVTFESYLFYDLDEIHNELVEEVFANQ